MRPWIDVGYFPPETARRLRFLAWLVARGRCTDWPERMPGVVVVVGPQRRGGLADKKGSLDVSGREVR